MLQLMPKKILQKGELAVKIYPVATELIWLHISCERGMTEEILHLVNEQGIHLPQLQAGLYMHTTWDTW